MWIETEKGDLVNLDYVQAIEIERESGSRQRYRLVAIAANQEINDCDDGNERYATHSDKKTVLAGCYDELADVKKVASKIGEAIERKAVFMSLAT